MSFINTKQNRGEIKTLDIYDENLKNNIKDKIYELQTKNKLLTEKVNS